MKMRMTTSSLKWSTTARPRMKRKKRRLSSTTPNQIRTSHRLLTKEVIMSSSILAQMLMKTGKLIMTMEMRRIYMVLRRVSPRIMLNQLMRIQKMEIVMTSRVTTCHECIFSNISLFTFITDLAFIIN